jgi:hypothetical protein
MKNQIFIALLFVFGGIVLSCQPKQTSTENMDEANADSTDVVTTKMTHDDSVRRGEYLINVMGCEDCHTPKIMTDKGPTFDPARKLSGHPASEQLPKITDKSMIGPGQWFLTNNGLTAWVGPWGTSFTANLTPHPTGTGTWTIENFDKAIRHGKFKGLDNGRTLLPPMPWQNFAKLTDEDLAYMWAYLRSIPPIDNTVPAAIAPM